jgi:HlyD family secretion protein
LNMLIVAAILALGVGYYVPQTLSSKRAETAKADGPPKVDAPLKQTAMPKGSWAASAPGRVEPLGGEVRITAQTPGRIAEVLTAVNDKVFAGDLLVRLDDEELLARVHSASAEAAIRKRDRDNNDAVGRPAQDRRLAEDAVANAERQLAQSRDELDRQVKARRGGSGTDTELAKARDAVGKARERLDQARAALRKALAVDGLTAPTRPEAALAAARADLSAAEAAVERMRIRAASAGSILLVNARAGEAVAPSPENVLVVVGDLSALRVKAEFEDRDIGKIRVGQVAVVRSDAFAGKDFEGKVVSLAQTLGPSRLGQRGPRKPNDVDVLEAIIDLDGQSSLLPGMRVDVFLKPDASPSAASKPATAAKAN